MRVVGFDPSLRNWGIAEAELCLETGTLSDIHLQLSSTVKSTTKSVRVNSSDLQRAEALAQAAIAAAKRAKVVFVEVPVGSQSANGMKSYGVCIGILGAIRSMGIPLIEVSPDEVKIAFTGNKLATKKQMIDKALEYYPDANFPKHAGKISASKAEHLADALAAIHAGVNTQMFTTIMRMHKP